MTRTPKPKSVPPLGKNLVLLLERKGWTQRRLAAVSGVPCPTINGWTAGVSRVDLENLRRVAAALEVAVYRLAFGLDFDDPFQT